MIVVFKITVNVNILTGSAYRIPEPEAHLPKIPCQPIGYDEAEVILR